MTRITSQTLNRQLLQDVGTIKAQLAETTRKLSSGRELHRPSDDPSRVARALALRSEIEGAAQHERTVDEAQGWADATDSALEGITGALQRIREQVVAAGNDAAGSAARIAIAQEVRGLLGSIKTAANASYGGRYVLSGTRTDVPPYRDADDAYQGDDGAIVRQIGPGVSLQTNVTGPDVLGTGGDDLLAMVRGVIANLESSNGNALRTTDLASLDRAIDRLTGARAVVGARVNRLDAAAERLTDLQLSARGLLSEVEDVDWAKATIDANSQRGALEAALKVGATVVQTSLLDFLR